MTAPYPQTPDLRQVPPAPPARRARPPLPREHRTPAFIAGGLGTLLGSWGLSALSAALLLGFIGLVFGLVASSIRSSDPTNGFVEFVDSVPAWVGVVAVLTTVVLATGLLIAAVVVPRAILRRAGVHRPTAVTWSALGIGIVANWFLGGILSIPFSLIQTFTVDPTALLVLVLIGLVVSLAATAAIGAFAGWWMAHAYRAQAAPAPAAPIPGPIPAPGPAPQRPQAEAGASMIS
ncbi:hypothetical protein GE115_04335 [Agromyces sp. CFH 90414]|uniref:Uncharacterized protein n=1 Tax=Agromyces agglutinans TaxID=2662258 RepID=A0A6I2F3F6_9MICO|nr:hypothetical protein [Agromyces agglutinans]MRG59099.1 hypothetical protein [Agromyces agglutinans]